MWKVEGRKSYYLSAMKVRHLEHCVTKDTHEVYSGRSEALTFKGALCQTLMNPSVQLLSAPRAVLRAFQGLFLPSSLPILLSLLFFLIFLFPAPPPFPFFPLLNFSSSSISGLSFITISFNVLLYDLAVLYEAHICGRDSVSLFLPCGSQDLNSGHQDTLTHLYHIYIYMPYTLTLTFSIPYH